jgi:hypothetical protein
VYALLKLFRNFMAVCSRKRLKSEIHNEVASSYTQDKLSKKSLLSAQIKICIQLLVKQSTSIMLANRN